MSHDQDSVSIMAINSESTRFLLWAFSRGVSFKSVLTLGRQHFCPSNRETEQMFRERRLGTKWLQGFDDTGLERYAEPFWKALGAQRIDSMDVSPYEQATLVHDLNRPVPAEMEEEFDVVFDGGTLEHVFHLPVALHNCLRMVKVGGHFIATTHANNFCGHGFYQFSPELFYRAFSAPTGFEVRRLTMVEFGPFCRWYDVEDPAKTGCRVQLVNAWPVMLFVLARKNGPTPSFWPDVQQSDYRAVWDKTAAELSPGPPTPGSRMLPNGMRKFLKNTIPRVVRSLEALFYSRFNPRYSFRNGIAFHKLNKKRLLSLQEGSNP